MKINSIHFSPNFGTYNNSVFNKDGKLQYLTHTSFFRPDLSWKDFALFIDKRFKNADKVNVYSFACSDGSEPYSLASMIQEYCKNPKKYFPIHASDIDKEAINLAKAGEYFLVPDEYMQGKMYLGNNYCNYFKTKRPERILYAGDMKVTDNIKDKVSFKQEDLIEGLKKINTENNIILCRNVMPYFDDKYLDELFKVLNEKIDGNSIFVIGRFDDKTGKTMKYIMKSGLKILPYSSNQEHNSSFHILGKQK